MKDRAIIKIIEEETGHPFDDTTDMDRYQTLKTLKKRKAEWKAGGDKRDFLALDILREICRGKTPQDIIDINKGRITKEEIDWVVKNRKKLEEKYPHWKPTEVTTREGRLGGN
jgi:hypothetical protein